MHKKSYLRIAVTHCKETADNHEGSYHSALPCHLVSPRCRLCWGSHTWVLGFILFLYLCFENALFRKRSKVSFLFKSLDDYFFLKQNSMTTYIEEFAWLVVCIENLLNKLSITICIVLDNEYKIFYRITLKKTFVSLIQRRCLLGL